MTPLKLTALALGAVLTACATPASSVRPSVMPIEEALVDNGGVVLYVKSVGHGPPLVVVHGGPGASHDYLLPNLYRLATSYRLIFIDERGSGRSPRLQDPRQYTVEKMADDVEAVRTGLQLGKIALLGHSYGGVVAQAYAFKYQANLSHLILASTFSSTRALNEALARLKRAMPSDRRARLEALEKAGLFDKGEIWEHNRYTDEYAKLAWGVGYFPALYGARPDANYDPLEGNTKNSWELYREMWGSHGEFVVDGNLKEVEWLDRLPEIKAPTLIVVGDHDQSDPGMSREMNARISGSKLVVLPDSGHMTFVDQPELFVRSIREFVR
ncbi:MAG TPA: proline iminopeptidase-family hydrolase [Myxococcaceae bacterium]|nr:proline iminopeptidase-family hydrolase [Myxococcaceae bacterium]